MSKKAQSTKMPQKQTKTSVEKQPEGVFLEPEVVELLESLPEDKKHLLISIMTSKSVSFQGPIPPPEILQGYNAILDGGADRIVKMAEKQLEHRIALEKTVIASQQKQSGRGQIFGFILAILCIGAAIYLGICNHDFLAGTIATTTILGLAATFVLGQIRQAKDLKNKR